MVRLFASLAGLGLIWGTSFMFIKVLLGTLEPIEIVFGRTFFGAAILIVIAMARNKPLIPLSKLPYGKLVLIAIANYLVPWLFISFGETKISSSLASIINATTPIWTMLIGFLFFSAKMRVNQWVGAVIGFSGIIILSDINGGSAGQGDLAGILFMSMAALFYGIGSHLSKRYANHIPVLEISLYTLVISSIISLLLMAASGFPSRESFFLPINLVAFIGVGAIGSGIAYLLYYYLIQNGGPEFAALVTYLAPVFAVIWGAALLGEQLTMPMVAGLLIIFCGVFYASRQKQPRMAAEKATGKNA